MDTTQVLELIYKILSELESSTDATLPVAAAKLASAIKMLDTALKMHAPLPKQWLHETVIDSEEKQMCELIGQQLNGYKTDGEGNMMILQDQRGRYVATIALLHAFGSSRIGALVALSRQITETSNRLVH